MKTLQWLGVGLLVGFLSLLLVLSVETYRYFDYHHKQMDTIERKLGGLENCLYPSNIFPQVCVKK